MNQIVRAIQAQRSSDCSQEIWNPWARIDGQPPGESSDTGNDGFTAACDVASATDDEIRVGQTDAPRTLVVVAVSRFGDDTYGGFARDANGNILVEFDTAFRPTDGSDCWLYVAQSNYWDQQS